MRKRGNERKERRKIKRNNPYGNTVDFSGVSSNRLTDISITQMIVKDEIDRLKRFKSPGPD